MVSANEWKSGKSKQSDFQIPGAVKDGANNFSIPAEICRLFG